MTLENLGSHWSVFIAMVTAYHHNMIISGNITGFHSIYPNSAIIFSLQLSMKDLFDNKLGGLVIKSLSLNGLHQQNLSKRVKCM